MADKGGFKQRLQRHHAQQQSQPKASTPATSMPSSSTTTVKSPDSNLGTLLVEKWAWGEMSLPALQKIAAAGEEDGLDQPLLRQALGLPKTQNPTHGINPPQDKFLGGNPTNQTQKQIHKVALHCLPKWAPENLTLPETGPKTLSLLQIFRRPSCLVCDRKLARIGTRGQHPNHMHRDMLRNLWGTKVSKIPAMLFCPKIA